MMNDLAWKIGGVLLAAGLLAACLPRPGASSASTPAAPYWKLMFSDDFEGNSLDATKWNPHDPWGRARNEELQAYVPDAFTVTNGVLRITAQRRVADYAGERRQFTSGMMTSHQKFAQRFGKFEVRARVPAGKGLWPAFWLLPEPLGWPPEIDVLEIIGSKTGEVHLTHHWHDEQKKLRSDTGVWAGPDFSREFHTFAIEWNSSEIRWLVDGVERHRSTRAIPQMPMFLLLNLAVGGLWPGAPDAQTMFPASFEVDYVRVYRRVE